MRSTEGLLLLKKERSLQHIVDNEAFALARFDFLKVVRLVFWFGVVGPGTNDFARSRFALVRSRFVLTVALRAQKLDL